MSNFNSSPLLLVLALVFLTLTFSSLSFVSPQCPHQQSGLINFSTLSNYNTQSANIVLTGGQQVLVDVSTTNVLRSIVVSSGTSLIFNDANLNLNVEFIRVESGGSLIMGSLSCPINNKIVVTFYGGRTTDNVIGSDPADSTETGMFHFLISCVKYFIVNYY